MIQVTYEVRQYGEDDALPCAELYNAVYRRVSTFVPVDAESMHRALWQPDSVHEEVSDPGTLVATDGSGRIAGFLAYCHRRSTASEPWHGLIRLLCCADADPWLATDLLAAARNAIGDYGDDALRFEGTGGLRPLNGGLVGMPARLSYLIPPLLHGGMKLTGNALVLSGSTTPPSVPGLLDAPQPARIVPAGPASFRAFADDEPIGECWIALHREWNSHPEAAAAAHLQWIVVDEKWRGRGVGAQLLSNAFSRLRELGVNNLTLTTAHDNLAAQACYYRNGLRATDQLLSFRSDGRQGSI